MKLFPAKISERATLQKSMTSVGNNALFHLGKHWDSWETKSMNEYNFKTMNCFHSKQNFTVMTLEKYDQ